VGYMMHLRHHPDDMDAIRKGARRTAATFVWDRVIDNLLSKLEYIARNQGVISA
jgi:hypothetical protein